MLPESASGLNRFWVAAKPIRADLVIDLLHADSPNHRKNTRQAPAVPRFAIATNSPYVAAMSLRERERTRPVLGIIEPCLPEVF